MAKSASISEQAEAPDDIRELADRILKRAEEVRVPAQKERAIKLARLVLRANPRFGERELRDDEVIDMLRAQNIGIPTFRKSLCFVRKDVPKPPRRTTSAKSATSHSSVEARPGPAKPAEMKQSVAATVDRNLL